MCTDERRLGYFKLAGLAKVELTRESLEAFFNGIGQEWLMCAVLDGADPARPVAIH